VQGNLVHRDRLPRSDSGLAADRHVTEQEFAAEYDGTDSVPLSTKLS
jgi:hypothetical protein